MKRAHVLRLLAATFLGALLVAACDTGRAEPVVIGEYHAPVGTWGDAMTGHRDIDTGP